MKRILPALFCLTDAGIAVHCIEKTNGKMGSPAAQNGFSTWFWMDSND